MHAFGFLEGQPFWLVYFTLLGVILLRVQATYWIGRGLGEGVSRSRTGRRLGPRLEAARERIDRYGAPVVTLSFLTVGVQTAVNLTAGAMRMRFGRYLLAMVLGSLIWAGLWSVVFSGVVGAWWALFLNSPWVAVGVTALAAVIVGALVLRARRRDRMRAGTRDRAGTAASDPAAEPPPEEPSAEPPLGPEDADRTVVHRPSRVAGAE
ncbi:DedA family protein [Nocardiopsis sp. FIRDI 009]|uniref:DedA family protein n=1 Tax=Nocardiopsis sp. FIRDI 009 TaxID=714197 RepID=UPI000E270F09|nr:VTT domain-containing protein [Nocardiopsis sp. FIRDI 009]